MGMKKMTTNDLYTMCRGGKNSLLWNALDWCKKQIAAGNTEAKSLLQSEYEGVYEDFGFFSTCMHPRESGLAVRILFDDEDAFIRYEGKHIALLRKDWKEGMTFEEQHTAITIEENPEFVSVMDLADISSFNLTEAEKRDIKEFISRNWKLIIALGTTTDPNEEGFVDSSDFYKRMIK